MKKKEFAAAVLDPEHETFVVYIVFFSSAVSIEKFYLDPIYLTNLGFIWFTAIYFEILLIHL